MQRDMDLARKLLFEIEREPYTVMPLEIDLAGYSSEVVEYHIILLVEAGLIEAQEPLANSDLWRAKRLTWQGHEFVDAIRDETIWQSAQGVLLKIGGFSMQLARPILLEIAKARLRELGIPIV